MCHTTRKPGSGPHRCAGRGDADAGDAQQSVVRRPVDFDREKLRMAQGPAGLGVQVEVEIRRLVSQYLIGFELVEAQQPVSLVEAVLPQERRLGDGRQVGPVTAGT